MMTMIWRKICRTLRSKTVLTTVIIVGLILLLANSVQHNVVKHNNKRLNQIEGEEIGLEGEEIGPDVSEVKKLEEPIVFTKPNSSHIINPYPFKFTILPQPCTDEQLVIIVHSAVQVSVPSLPGKYAC